MCERLEEKAVAAWRGRLLTASASTIRTMWNETETVRGGTEHVVFGAELKREIIAQLLANYVSWIGGHVYGSWARTRNNGKPWRDIDLALTCCGPLTQKVPEFVNGFYPFISFVIDDLCPRNIEVSEFASNERYPAKTFVFSVFLAENSFKLRCDVSDPTTFKGTHYTPVTYGSCLKWSSRKGFEIRDCFDREFIRFSVDDILGFLREGKDVKLATIYDYHGHAKSDYALYYWPRILQLKNDGVILDEGRTDGNEPQRPKPTELGERLAKTLSLKLRIG